MAHTRVYTDARHRPAPRKRGPESGRLPVTGEHRGTGTRAAACVRAASLSALVAVMFTLGLGAPHRAEAQATSTTIAIADSFGAGLVLPSLPVSGRYRMLVTFNGITGTTGFDADDVTVSPGSVTSVGRFGSSTNRYVAFVVVDDAMGGNEVVFSVRANAIDQGNPAATPVTRTTAASMTVTMTTTASEPVSGDFTVRAVISPPSIGPTAAGEAIVPGGLNIIPPEWPSREEERLLKYTNCGQAGAFVAEADGNDFTLTVRPRSNFRGTCRVDARAGRLKQATERNITNQPAFIEVQVDTRTDKTDPTVTSIGRQSPATTPTNGDSLTWRVTFSESVTNVDAADFEVAGTTATATVTAVPGSSAQYDVTASGGNLAGLNGTVTLSFASSQNIEDLGGNALTNTTPTETNDNTYDVDNIRPTVTSIGRQSPATTPTNGDSLTWRVTFSESVTNVDAADFAVAGTTATVTAVSGSSAQYDVTASGGNLAGLDGTVTLSFESAQNIEDSVGNALTNTTSTGTNHNTYVVDNTRPTVTITGVPQTSSAPFTATFTFSEGVDGFVLGAITVANGSPSAFSGSDGDTVYTALITPDADGSVTVDVAANAARDTAGNGNTEAAQASSNYTASLNDTTSPTVTAIGRQSPATTPTNGDSLTWRVTFSESVRNVDEADFKVAGTTATVTAVSGSSAQYDVTASGGNLAGLDGTVTLSFESAQNIEDLAGNDLTNTTPTVTNDNTYVVDNTRPTVTITGVPPTSSAPFTATFTFSMGVDGFVLGEITVANGSPSTFTGSDGDTVYTALITPDADGPVTVDVAANAARDTAGNGNTEAAQASSNYTTSLVVTTPLVVIEPTAADTEAPHPVPKAWIARFGRTVAEQVIGAVERRLEDARLRAARTAGMSVSLAGRQIGVAVPKADEKSGAATDGTSTSLFGATANAGDTAGLKALSDWLSRETEEKDRSSSRFRTMTEREVLMGSSFSLAAETGAGGFVSLWGRMAQSRFAGREDTLSLDGDVTTGLLGADYASGRWTTGLVISNSVGEGGYRGAIEATVTALTPWAGYAVTERLSVWGAAGYGAGGLTLTPGDDAALKTDLKMMLAAAGARGMLVAGDGPKLDMVGDVRVVRTTTASVSAAGRLESAEAEVTQLRLGLDGSWPLALDDGAAVTPRLTLGLRHDGGDAETGFGADIGGGVTFEGPAQGLTVSLEGRGVLTHEASGFRDRGLAGSLAWSPQPSGRGPELTLTQTVGAEASGGKDALLARETLEGLAANDDGDGRRRLEVRFGYGIGVSGGRFTMTPEIGLGLSDAGRDASLGWRLTQTGSGPGSLELSLEARRRESANDNTPARHRIGFRLTARF